MDKKYKDIHIKRKGIDIYVQRMAQDVRIYTYEDSIDILFKFQINENVLIESRITLNLKKDNYLGFTID